MLETVAPEANSVKISGQIFQNHDSWLGENLGVTHSQPRNGVLISEDQDFEIWWYHQNGRCLGGSWVCLEGFVDGSCGLWTGVGGAWGVLEWSLDGRGYVLGES